MLNVHGKAFSSPGTRSAAVPSRSGLEDGTGLKWFGIAGSLNPLRVRTPALRGFENGSGKTREPGSGTTISLDTKRRTLSVTGWSAGVLLAGWMAFVPRVSGQVLTIDAPGGFNDAIAPFVPVPFVPFESLKKVPNPVIPKNPTSGLAEIRPDLADYIADLPSAIRLGKALFWDMQAGSDQRTACATCHFQAGADPRRQSQLHPGSNGRLDNSRSSRSPSPTDFSLASAVERDDIVGSQGVRKSAFVRARYSKPDVTQSLPDQVSSASADIGRQVTARNTPTSINAVFNHRNFHDGRAQAEFNGVNAFGERDTNAHVWSRGLDGVPAPVRILIGNASLASQAVAPPTSSIEMSAAGRSFPALARKLLRTRPLMRQKVDPSDSVLGSVAGPSAGLTVTYQALIRQAFQPKWWDSERGILTVNGTNSLTEANFSLFWGLSLMLYQATLVSDGSPMDQFLDSGRTSLAALEKVAARLRLDLPGITASSITNGLALFEQDLPPLGAGVGCSVCHAGAETTSASVRRLTGHGLEPGDVVMKKLGFDLRMERMFSTFPLLPPGTDQIAFDPAIYKVTATRSNGIPIIPPLPVPVGVYDSGWYNIGVRPTAEDPGLDASDPFGNSLSWTKMFQALPDPSIIKVPGGALPQVGAGSVEFLDQVVNAAGLPLLSGPLVREESNSVAGTFKTSTLRNVELTGPYFHNGGKATLRQVVSFYKRGGDFANPTLAPEIQPLDISSSQVNDLVAFLVSLTDDRVRWQQAPFDHPQLFVPSTKEGDDEMHGDDLLEIPAVGAEGSTSPLGRFLGLNPFE